MSEATDRRKSLLYGGGTQAPAAPTAAPERGPKPRGIRAEINAQSAEVQSVGDDSYEICIPSEFGNITVMCNQVQLSRHSFDVVISVGIAGAMGRRFPYSERINLLSGSARDSLRRALENFYVKDLPWAEVLNTAYILARRAHLESDPAVQADQIPEPPDLSHLIAPLLLDRVPSVLFGNGEAGKSFIAMGIAAAFTLCDAIAGMTPEHYGPAMYIDYETDRNTFRWRWGRVVLGLGHVVVPTAPMFYWPGRGIPLPDQIDAIDRRVRKEGIELIIVDSAAPACGGKPEDADTTTRYFNALALTGATSLTLAHVSKGGETRTPFGSVFWTNLPRRLWYAKRADKDSPDVMDLGLYCLKNNNGPTPRPVGIRLGFSDREQGGDGAIRFSPTEVGENHDLAEELPQHQQLWHALWTPMTPKELADESGLKETVVRALLNRHRGKLFSKAGSGEKWSRMARAEEGA